MVDNNKVIDVCGFLTFIIMLVSIIILTNKRDVLLDQAKSSYDCNIDTIIELCPGIGIEGTVNTTENIKEFTIYDTYSYNCLEEYFKLKEDGRFDCYIVAEQIYTQNMLDKDLFNYDLLFWSLVGFFIIFVLMLCIPICAYMIVLASE